LTKGKAWPAEDERKLKDWFTSGTTDIRVLAFSFDGQYSEVAIRLKLARLGLLKEDDDELVDSTRSSSSTLELPEELPSVEEALKTLAAALEALKVSGLERNEILRLKSVVLTAKVYKEILVDYVNYRRLETELFELRNKYGELAKKSGGPQA
jgi:hypothetical protein